MQDTVTKCLGLVTQFNPLAVAPGALVKADNAVCLRENIFENRRGYSLDATLSGSATALMPYQSRVLAQFGSTLSYRNTSTGTGTWASYSGSYSPVSGYRMRWAQTRSNLLVTTSLGVKVFSDVAGTAGRLAGAPRSLDPSFASNAAGSGFLATSSQCAYRAVITRTDANSNVMIGYPSQRVWVTNSAGTGKNIDLTLYLPAECIAGDSIQFYRTLQATGTASDTAGDECKLAYQYTLKSADITAGFITFTDSLTDALLGANLYTNPNSGSGIIAANDRPPVCKDLALYRSSYMIYANTSTKMRLVFNLIGTSGLTGNTITLAGTSYSFSGGSENTATGQVLVSATGVAAVDIDLTARSLVRVINRYTSNTSVYAYYLSGYSDLPGQILIEERGLGAAAYTIAASNTTISGMFSPNPPTSGSTSASTSSNDVNRNRLFYSKADEPEHVPAIQYFPAGPANEEILRVAPLQDCIIIIGAGGVYRLTGQTPSNFVVTPLDLTIKCVAADSVVVLNNQVYMLSNQGVCAITTSGVEIVSREIEDSLKPLVTYSNISTYTSGAAYDSDKCYLLAVPTTTIDTGATQTFVYNYITKCWSRFSYGFQSALVDPSTDKLFFTKSSDSSVYRERKDFASSDYSDPESAVTITTISGKTVAFTFAGQTPQAGWQLAQGSSSIVISSVVLSGGTATATLLYSAPASWSAGAALLYPNTGMDVKWNFWTGGSPGLLKHVRQIEILTDSIAGNNNTTSLVATFETDLDGTSDTVTINSAAYKWGSAPWGQFPWGGVADSYSYPCYVPRNKQYCRLFSVGVRHLNANERISIAGFSVTFDVISEKVSR
jgi:hypothetical protein